MILTVLFIMRFGFELLVNGVKPGMSEANESETQRIMIPRSHYIHPQKFGPAIEVTNEADERSSVISTNSTTKL